MPWLVVLAISLLFILGNGIEYVTRMHFLRGSLADNGRHRRYVNWPQLNPPDEILQYEGSGFRSRRNGRGKDLLGLQGRRAVAQAESQLKKLV